MRADVGGLLERWFCYFAISIMMGAYVYIPLKLSGAELSALHPPSGTQNGYHAASQALITGGLVVLSGLRWRDMFGVIARCPALTCFLALAFLSTLWSFDPTLTMRRSITLLTPLVFAYYLVARFPVSEAIRMIARASVMAGAASAFFAIVVPRVGVMLGAPGEEEQLAGAWCGVFSHKNDLGSTMVIACIAVYWLYTQETRGRRIRLGQLALCAGVALMTRSLTAQIGVLLILPVAYSLRLLRLEGMARLWAGYFVALSCIAATVFITFFFADTMEALGKDASLTGRVPLWGVLIQEVLNRPLLGYGYGAFFLPDNPDLLYVQRVIGWEAPSAHQGYLDLALQLGLPGVALGTWIMFSTMVRAMSEVRRRALDWASLAAVYTVILSCTSNMFEAMLLHEGDLNCLMLSYLYAALVVARGQRRVDRATQDRGRPESISFLAPSALPAPAARAREL